MKRHFLISKSDLYFLNVRIFKKTPDNFFLALVSCKAVLCRIFITYMYLYILKAIYLKFKILNFEL